MHHADSQERTVHRWRVFRASGVRPDWVGLAPSEQLRGVTAAGGDESWESGDGRACLALDAEALGAPLAAGWYELRGRLQAERGAVLPSLYLQYADRSALTDAEVMLPQPSANGRIGTLLMLFEDVQSLRFFPGVGNARFRMHGFSLRRVSRWQALRRMLGGDGWLACARRTLAWRRAVRQHGLKRATDALYANYRERMRPPGFTEYELWIRKYDTIDRAALAALRKCALTLAEHGPLVSVLMCACETPEPQLRRCLDSVLAQAWERWELCVAGDLPPASPLHALLAEYVVRDPRVRVCRSGQGGAAAEALAMAHGEFVVLLEPDGLLRPHALLRVSEAVLADSELAILYSDEDAIDADGNRSSHAFKPDWNPDLLRSRNYVGHLVAIRTSLVREAGGFQGGCEDGRDYALILRCSERVAARQIHHIPEILYHRCIAIHAAAVRDVAGTAGGERAVAEHLQRIGSAAAVETIDAATGLRRVRWPLPQPVPKVSLIVPTRDRAALLRTCVESILAKTTYPDYELVVVDNQSRDRAALGYLHALGSRERVRVLRHDAPFNYSAINNWAARQCEGRLLGLVNNDIEIITPDWLQELAGFALRPDTGAVGAMLYYPGDTIQHAGMWLGIHGVAGHAYVGKPRGYHGYQSRGLLAQDVSVVTGACLLVRREAFDAVGGLDEGLPLEFNDVDFCLRLQQRGYRNVWTPFAELYHHESASRAIDDVAAKASRAAGIAFMRDRWGDLLRNDPAYNPNLALQGTGFGLAFPPRRIPRARLEPDVVPSSSRRKRTWCGKDE